MKHIFFSPLFALVVLTGCSNVTNNTTYSDKLGLTEPTKPQILSPIPTNYSGEMAMVIASIRDANSVPQIDRAENSVKDGRSGIAIFGGILAPTTNDSPDVVVAKNKRSAELNELLTNLEQAVQIKRAQINNHDLSDSTGEVTRRLDNATQYAVNFETLSKTIPTVTPPPPVAGIPPRSTP